MLNVIIEVESILKYVYRKVMKSKYGYIHIGKQCRIALKFKNKVIKQ